MTAERTCSMIRLAVPTPKRSAFTSISVTAKPLIYRGEYRWRLTLFRSACLTNRAVQRHQAWNEGCQVLELQPC